MSHVAVNLNVAVSFAFTNTCCISHCYILKHSRLSSVPTLIATFSFPANTSCMPRGTVVYLGTHVVYLQTQHALNFDWTQLRVCLHAETTSRVKFDIQNCRFC